MQIPAPWWLDETPPTYYQADSDGVYVGAGEADPSPLEPGVWLLPGNATWTAPPPHGETKAAVLRDTGWEIVDDYRGIVLWQAPNAQYPVGRFVTATDLGSLPEGVEIPRIHDAQYVAPEGNLDPDGARIRVWVGDTVIDIEDDPATPARMVLAGWEAKGETIRPVDAPEPERVSYVEYSDAELAEKRLAALAADLDALGVRPTAEET